MLRDMPHGQSIYCLVLPSAEVRHASRDQDYCDKGEEPAF